VALDTYAVVNEFVDHHQTLSISHQWLGWSEPDPKGVHYPAANEAAATLCTDFGMAEDDLYLRVDYSSIPQENQTLQKLSIQSIGGYSSITHFFVILCPSCTHNVTSVPCDFATYQQRGWCRLEQWARMASGGLADMYVHEEGSLSSFRQHTAMCEDSMHVFDGNFTVDSHKYTLVDAILGLWAKSSAQKNSHPQLQELHSLIEKHRDTVLPVSIFGDLIEIMGEIEPKMGRLLTMQHLRTDEQPYEGDVAFNRDKMRSANMKCLVL